MCISHPEGWAWEGCDRWVVRVRRISVEGDMKEHDAKFVCADKHNYVYL